MQHDGKILQKYLQDILTIPSPTGYTAKVMDYVKKELDELGVCYEMTNKGALVVTLPGADEENQLTFSGHVDTLGAMVKSLKKTGKLELTPVGGYMMNSIEGENCLIHTLGGKEYTGTIQSTKPSVHISSDEARKLERTPKNMEVVIDERVESDEDVRKLGIEVGDFISFETRTRFTASGFLKSRHLDDKASVAILLYAIRHIVKHKVALPRTVNFFISNYEEVGHGASAHIPPKTTEFVSVDMGCPGLNQNSTEYAVCICAKDSSGPYDFDFRRRLVALCEEKKIPYRIDIYPSYGSDASAALRAGWDMKTALIGAGIFASHGYERTHMDSISATLKLVLAYALEG